LFRIFHRKQPYLLPNSGHLEGDSQLCGSPSLNEEFIDRIEGHIGDASRSSHAVPLDEKVEYLGALGGRELVHTPDNECSCLSCQALLFKLLRTLCVFGASTPRTTASDSHLISMLSKLFISFGNL
jgi:hypothetical protein